jgi:serine/threonine protein kinase
VHGDIKLNNIGRHKGTYKLLDTGLSTPFKEYGPELATALSILRHTVEQHGGTLPSERTMEIKRTPKEIERPSETYAGRDDIYAIAQLGCYVLGKETAYDYCVRTTHLGDDFVFHSPHHNDRHHHFPSERSHYIDPDLPLANRITEEEADAVEALISRCLNHPETSIEDLLTSPLFRPPSARSLVSGLS